ncbi:MAG TPA: DUF3795 domain-containing protein [Thermoplasmata archaeon]|nr:DUF3795 domain-containing protein [Thermoplasmata archaeon]
MHYTETGTKGKDASSAPAFENVKDQIGYCGLWCGSCAVGNGTIGELAGRLEKLTKDYGIEEWGPEGIDYMGLHKSLASIHTLPPCPGCLKGGGRTNCEIRACATDKHLGECAECKDSETCKNLEILHHMCSGALGVGMMVKEKKGNRSEFLKKGKAELKRRHREG